MLDNITRDRPRPASSSRRTRATRPPRADLALRHRRPTRSSRSRTHDAERFAAGEPGFLTNDEESSGIIDVSTSSARASSCSTSRRTTQPAIRARRGRTAVRDPHPARQADQVVTLAPMVGVTAACSSPWWRRPGHEPRGRGVRRDAPGARSLCVAGARNRNPQRGSVDDVEGTPQRTCASTPAISSSTSRRWLGGETRTDPAELEPADVLAHGPSVIFTTLRVTPTRSHTRSRIRASSSVSVATRATGLPNGVAAC